uniref:Putative secreted protein n=1 Tax=Ixodes ricinus TaxID=34613 RepID=A0A6B0TV59_IXORI
MQTKPVQMSRILLSLGVLGLWVRSRMTKPRPPTVKRKLDARPSMMYWPLTRYGMKATGLLWPCSSTVDPMLGGSTITS